MKQLTVIMLLIVMYMIGFFSAVWGIRYYQKFHSEPVALHEPLSLGNNVRRSYTIRTRDKEIDVIEFVSDRNDYCVLTITEVTISGAQSVALACLPGYN